MSIFKLSLIHISPYVSGFCHIHGKTPRGILPVNSYDIITNGENTLITGGNL